MSIYHPPSKTQSIFNPSNFGGLGAGGQITTEYLDANYVQFPVAQGNTTLVGTSVFGTISQQQGDFTTTGDLIVDSVNVITEIGTKQDTIEDGDLTIAKTSGLQTALNGKQDTIENGDLTIANTNGLQTALDDKQDTIEDGDLTIAFTDGLQTALNGKQDTIEDGDLTISKTSGLQTALDAKQATITTATDLTSKTLTTNDLVVNESLNINNVITYEKYRQFDTLVIRRFDNTSTLPFNLNEIQVFVNNDNILFPNPTGLTSYFADWSDKFTPIAPRTVNTVTEKVYNNIIEYSVEAESTGSTTALIINNIPLTFLNDIQAIVLYHRGGDGNILRSLGLTIELYNSVDDPTLTQVLASTIPITDETKDYLQRYDFPSISTYTNGFFSTTYQSTTQIPDIGKGQQSTATINDIDAEVNITGNVDISGDLVVGTTNIITELGTKQDEITTTTDLTSNSLTTIGSGTIGGNLTISGSLTNRNQPAFKATTTQTLQPSVDTNIIFNNPITDTDSGYNSSTGEYTIQSAGNWYFYYSFQSNGVAFKVELQKEGIVKDQVFTDLALTSGTNLGCKGMVIIPCFVGNVIRVRVKSGSVRIENGGFFEFHSFGGFLIG